jgi:hypothetical protein
MYEQEQWLKELEKQKKKAQGGFRLFKPKPIYEEHPIDLDKEIMLTKEKLEFLEAKKNSPSFNKAKIRQIKDYMAKAYGLLKELEER